MAQAVMGTWFHEISFNTMAEQILPQIPNINVDATKKALEAAHHLRKAGWAAFPQTPADDPDPDISVFKALETVHKQIADCAQFVQSTPRPNPTLGYVVSGNKALTHSASERLPNTSRPDGYGHLQPDQAISLHKIASRPHKQRHNWFDIAYADEYEKKDGPQERDDNVEKVLWSMQHIMRIDARRRFTFGLTIENTTIRVWFANRQSVMVSEPFDFMKDQDKFIHLVLSLTFASIVELGWDPSMALWFDKDTDKWGYDIKVFHHDGTEPTRYRTDKILSGFAADALRGRGTRVFEAYQIDEHGTKIGPNVAIKDVWIDSSRTAEADILKAILKDATPEEKEHFLTILVWGNVLIDGREDHTEDVMMRGMKVDYENRRVCIGSKYIPIRQYTLGQKADSQQLSAGTSCGIGLPPSANRLPLDLIEFHQFHAKRHQRIVFKEIGTTVYNLKSMRSVFSAARDVSKALEIMFKNGSYVHRDVSPGNILIVDGKARLADLEYAKVMGSDGQHDVRTGTVNFMAVEVSKPGYLFPTTNFLPKHQLVSFVHNPLHDLESVWWIVIWCLFWNAIDKTPNDSAFPQSEDQIKDQLMKAAKIFSSDQYFTFAIKTIFLKHCIDLMDVQDLFATHAENARQTLVDAFSDAEAMLPNDIDVRVFADIHESFAQPFISAMENCEDYRLRSGLEVYDNYRLGHKRKRAEEDEEEDDNRALL